MPIARNLTLETVNFGDSEEVDAVIKEIMDEGMRRVQSEGTELRTKGLIDAKGNRSATELPPDMKEGSERDCGG